VSTYVSPLPIAYTGLLIVPVAISLLLGRDDGRPALLERHDGRPRIFPAAVLILLVAGILFSVTRLAMLLLVPELLVLALIWRRWWIAMSAAIAAIAVAAILFGYPHVGPLVTADLAPVLHRPSNLGILARNDPSAAEHSATLAQDLEYAIRHPLGAGIGTSIPRFGQHPGTGESALFDVFGEIGFLGGLIYLVAYGLMLVYGLRGWIRSAADPLLSGLALVSLVGALALVPIMVTSDVWSDFSITFLLWWAAGYAVSLASAPA
jgi:hypothetical protein